MPKEKCSRWWKLPNILNGDIFNPIWSWCCQRAEIGRKCDYFVWIGTDKRKESDDADDNLRRGEVEVELAQLGNNGRTECGQWIPPSHISLSSKLANTLLVDICWWKCFGGKILLRLPDTGRKVWANFTEDTFPPSPGMLPEKSTKLTIKLVSQVTVVRYS